ncbi:hypothetical protein KCM76_11555 [Zooshikella marina]|uniref:hypothetical protein n=1 Tax=Zooshikella ganghwensis TaxID=202772 RepID=UPI001BAFCCBD|nr:hypothetical protein [Zooshikella ganghwensis]MBU2706619.1 hypothetical protein [Zooshikella ganghwensis]
MAYFYSLNEYLRPWKLFSLACGIALLILGSIYTPAPDWDILISFIMAGFTYLTAPCSLRTVLKRNWRHVPLALFATWFTVDGCYAIYWYYKDPVALEFMRSANFLASFGLYGICGVIWLYRGSLRQLLADVRKALSSGRS